MSVPPPKLTRLSTEDYLEMELTSPIKHEYVAGEIFAMTGTSDSHNIISLNLAFILREHLRGTPCRVTIYTDGTTIPSHSLKLEIAIERIYESAWD